MTLESELFLKLKPDREKMKSCGFVPSGSVSVYRKPFMDGQFEAEVTVDEKGNVSGRVMDTELGEEYVLVHAHVRSSFAAEVRSAYLEILEDLARSCFVPKDYLTAQAEYAADLVLARYGDRPDRPWKKENGYTVIRNHENRKWYGLIGEITLDKLIPDAPEEKCEILNVKVPEEKMADCLATPGIWPAYHMNKKNWISVLLDNDVPDERIAQLLAESRAFTETRKKDLAVSDWLIPANPAYYDVLGAFRRKRTRYWPTRKKMAVGDTVYIYYAAPYSCLVARCLVTGHDERGATGLTLQEFYERGRYPLALLKEHGCRTVRFVTRLPQELKEFLDDCREKEKS